MNKCKDPRILVRTGASLALERKMQDLLADFTIEERRKFHMLGGALREMMYSLKYGESPPVIPYRALPLSPETIEKGRKIIERLKAKISEEPVLGSIFRRGDKVRILRVNPESVYPLKRDPKTGRMMKAGRE